MLMLVFQMLSALEMCNSTGIAHRDIKPENILLDSNFQLRMADFGLSSIMEVGETGLIWYLDSSRSGGILSGRRMH